MGLFHPYRWPKIKICGGKHNPEISGVMSYYGPILITGFLGPHFFSGVGE